jgi:hypothetical protein
MRSAIAILAVLVIPGGFSLALADPPAPPVSPDSPSSAARSSAGEDGARQDGVPQTATAATSATAPPAAVAAKPAPKASEEKSDERVLRDEGYRPQMKNGEVLWCRREVPLGTRLTTQLKCITVEESKLIAEEGRRTAERIQRGQGGCLATGTARGPSTGPANCGN